MIAALQAGAAIILPLLEEAVVSKLLELVAQREGLEELYEILPDVLDSIDSVIEHTTRLETGLALHK